MALNVVLTGQRTFGAAALAALCDDGANVVAVCAPGAGEDRTRHEAHKRGLLWVPSEEWRADAVPKGTDLIVAAHSHAFLGRKSRSRAKYGAIGYHPSLLPRHRGRDAVRWTIHMRDPIAGGSVYYLTDNVDAGPIVCQDWCHVDPNWSYQDLWREALFPMGVKLLLEATRAMNLGEGRVRMVPQNEKCATWEPSWGRAPMYRPELIELGSGDNGVRIDLPGDDGAEDGGAAEDLVDTRTRSPVGTGRPQPSPYVRCRTPRAGTLDWCQHRACVEEGVRVG